MLSLLKREKFAHRRGDTIPGQRPHKLCILRFRLKPKTHSRRCSAFSHRNHWRWVAVGPLKWPPIVPLLLTVGPFRFPDASHPQTGALPRIPLAFSATGSASRDSSKSPRFIRHRRRFGDFPHTPKRPDQGGLRAPLFWTTSPGIGAYGPLRYPQGVRRIRKAAKPRTAAQWIPPPRCADSALVSLRRSSGSGGGRTGLPMTTPNSFRNSTCG